MTKLLTKKVVVSVLILIAIAAVGASAYFYQQYQKSQQLIQNPTLAAAQQTKDLIDKVGKLIKLPTDEQPTIATVSDVTKLKGQPFFTDATNGDQVLIYTKNKFAILYDPTKNIIVKVAPLTIGPAVSPTGVVTPTPTKKPVKPTATPTPKSK